MNRKMLKVLVGQEPIIAITTGVSNRDGVNEKSRCHMNQGYNEFKASYVITRLAAPIITARVKRPPGTTGFTAGGRQVSVYLSDHAIAAGNTPNKTNTGNETTNNKCVSNFMCKIVTLGSRKLQEFMKGYPNANKASLLFTGPSSYLHNLHSGI